MEMTPSTLLLLVGGATLFGAVLFSLWYAPRAEAIRLSEKSAMQSTEARLNACEAALEELVKAISRMEARDKMRQVRAVRTMKEAEAKAASQTESDGSLDEPPPETARISTAELRRQIAARRIR